MLLADNFCLHNFSLFQKVPTHDGLIRIQNEISEVEKREIELRKEHASSRSNSVNGDEEPQPKPIAAVDINSKDHFKKNKIIEPRPRPQFIPPALTRAYSTPQLFQVSPMKRFNVNAPHRGIMEKFIASRGKMLGNQQYTTTQNNFKKNLMMVRQHPSAVVDTQNSNVVHFQSPIEFNNGSIKSFTSAEIERPAIERDTQGRPVRKGFIPVEEKIQSELRDLKNRESELKRLHKLRDSDDDYNSSDDLDSSDSNLTWSPINGKLSKSIDALNGSSLSPT